MMIYLFLLQMALQVLSFNTDVKEVVIEFHTLTSEEKELCFIEKYNKSRNPSVMAYVTSISMKQAEYVHNPFQKLQMFELNRDKLNILIDENSTNIHLRYVRLISQENSPFFLGYNASIDEDKMILKNILDVVDETDYLDDFIKANTSL